MLYVFILLLILLAIVSYGFVRLWKMYFQLLDYHNRFLENTENVLRETNKYLEIPIFEFTPEVRSWVNLVKSFRNSMKDALMGFEVVVEVEESSEQSNEQTK
jgi:hypothetical protein